MRDGRDTTVVRMEASVCCIECGAEDNGQGEVLRWARKHAAETGHIPTVTVVYDVHKKEPTNE